MSTAVDRDEEVSDVTGEAAPPEENEPRSVEAVTALTFVWTVEGSVVMTTPDMALVRRPTDTDVRMLALYLHDQVIANPAPKDYQATVAQNGSIKERLEQLLAELP